MESIIKGLKRFGDPAYIPFERIWATLYVVATLVFLFLYTQ